MMLPEHAVILMKYTVPELVDEFEATRLLLLWLPEERRDFRPSPSSPTLLEVAWQLASTDILFLEGILSGRLCGRPVEAGPDRLTFQEIGDWYKEKTRGLIRQLDDISAQELARPVFYRGARPAPGVSCLALMAKQSAFHRGQLAVYIELMRDPEALEKGKLANPKKQRRAVTSIKDYPKRG